jgi:PEGA domain
MERAAVPESTPASGGFRDGLGERRHMAGPAGNETLEQLCLRSELAAVPSFEFALRERVSRLASFRHPQFGRARGVERLTDHDATLAVVSESTAGVRLSDLIANADQRRLGLDITAALCLIRQLVPAVAALHESARDVAHGAIGPERLVVTPDARLVVVEYVLGAALEQLRFPRERYWSELRVALPHSAGVPRFDQRADVTQIGVVALSLILGRNMRDDEYPARIADVVASTWAVSPSGGFEPLPPGLRGWLGRALQLDARTAFPSAIEARAELDKVLGDGEYAASPESFRAFLARYNGAEQLAPTSRPASRPPLTLQPANHLPAASVTLPRATAMTAIPAARGTTVPAASVMSPRDTASPAVSLTPPRGSAMRDASVTLPRSTLVPEVSVTLPRATVTAPRDTGVPEVSVTPPRDTVPEVSWTLPRGAVTPPRDTVTPPRDTLTPPRGTLTPPRGTLTPPRGTAVPAAPVTLPRGTAVQAASITLPRGTAVPAASITLPRDAAMPEVSVLRPRGTAIPASATPPRGTAIGNVPFSRSVTTPQSGGTTRAPSATSTPPRGTPTPPRGTPTPPRGTPTRGSATATAALGLGGSAIAATPPHGTARAPAAAASAKPWPTFTPTLASAHTPALPVAAPLPIVVAPSTMQFQGLSDSLTIKTPPRGIPRPPKPAVFEPPPPAADIDVDDTGDNDDDGALSRNWPKIAAVVAVLMALVAGGAFAGRRFLVRAPAAFVTTGVLAITTNPTGAQATVDGQPRGETPLTVELHAGAHKIELRGAGGTKIVPVTIAAGSHVAQHIEMPRTASAAGQLQIRTEPSGARVTVDGVARGISPVMVPELSAGEHAVLLESDLGSTKQTVTIESGATASLVLPLVAPAAPQSGSGWIAVSAPVEMQLFESDRLLGTSRSDRIVLPSGRHEIDIVSDELGYRVTRTVKVVPGKVAALSVEMPKGTLALNAAPWAEVWIDGEKVGDTPIGNLSLAIGAHDVVFRNPDLGEQHHTVMVTLKEVVRLSVDLRKQ